ncbi:MAG: hypothetical protein ACE37F_27705 [Nannocystaceae bacterium]|nr:hypothetical protein [bacterium]
MTSNATPRAAATAALISLVLAACGADSAPTPSGTPTQRSAPQAFVDETPDAPRFEVHVEAPEHAPPGKEVLAKVHVQPRKPWHMNTEFPVALAIDDTVGVTVDVAKQVKDDAERFDDDGLVFALPFTPTSDGPKHIAGEVRFAVCGDAACAPEVVPVDFTVDVGCDTGALC